MEEKGKWLGIERDDGTVTNPSSWIDSEIADIFRLVGRTLASVRTSKKKNDYTFFLFFFFCQSSSSRKG